MSAKCWCRRGELNTRPLPYQGSALPLSYGGGLSDAHDWGLMPQATGPLQGNWVRR